MGLVAKARLGLGSLGLGPIRESRNLLALSNESTLQIKIAFEDRQKTKEGCREAFRRSRRSSFGAGYKARRQRRKGIA